MTNSTDNSPRRIGLIQDDFLGGMWALASKDEADIAVQYIRADLTPDPLVDPRIEELEAKLTVAVETLQTIDDVIEAKSELFSSDLDLLDNLRDRIRTTLAELKGQDDV